MQVLFDLVQRLLAYQFESSYHLDQVRSEFQTIAGQSPTHVLLMQALLQRENHHPQSNNCSWELRKSYQNCHIALE